MDALPTSGLRRRAGHVAAIVVEELVEVPAGLFADVDLQRGGGSAGRCDKRALLINNHLRLLIRPRRH
jgi:hypothetical protein